MILKEGENCNKFNCPFFSNCWGGNLTKNRKCEFVCNLKNLRKIYGDNFLKEK